MEPSIRGKMESLLKRSQYGHISTINEDGSPYTIGVNLLFNDNKFYFHCGLSGKKLDNIRRDQRVCVNVDEMILLKNQNINTACDTSVEYESVIVYGKAEILNDIHKRNNILKLFAQKYSPGTASAVMPEQSLNRTLVVEISMDEIYFKEHGR